MAKRPRIGITMRLETETQRFYLGRHYSEAVEGCGGVPVHLALIPKAEYIAEALAGVDAVLLPGSNTDVHPAFYGEEPHQNLGTVIPEKDETDRLVLAEAERRGLPLLAICYGMQALNVFRGGTLVQDIGAQIDGSLEHEQGKLLAEPVHSLRVIEDSVIGIMTEGNDVRVNSSHHQAVARVGEDLRATAWAEDGVVECIECTRNGQFVLGVQWHPEVSWASDPLSNKIFQTFVRAV